MSDTPICNQCFEEAGDFSRSSLVIPLAIGRDLERELNEARKTIELKDAAISLLQIGKSGTVHLSDQLNEANADRLRLREAVRLMYAASPVSYVYACDKARALINSPPPPVVTKADADALVEAVEIMRVGICSAAMPNATEREIASDAVKQASEVLKAYRTKYQEANQ
jgi:hypothetical protein